MTETRLAPARLDDPELENAAANARLKILEHRASRRPRTLRFEFPLVTRTGVPLTTIVAEYPCEFGARHLNPDDPSPQPVLVNVPEQPAPVVNVNIDESPVVSHKDVSFQCDRQDRLIGATVDGIDEARRQLTAFGNRAASGANHDVCLAG